jgi:hypothetical protein
MQVSGGPSFLALHSMVHCGFEEIDCGIDFSLDRLDLTLDEVSSKERKHDEQRQRVVVVTIVEGEVCLSGNLVLKSRTMTPRNLSLKRKRKIKKGFGCLPKSICHRHTHFQISAFCILS